jgi:peptidoglycan/LPS O-acetylase OafA/YrhL
MAKLLFIKRTPLKVFYERRISRIIPVFVLYLLSVYLIAYFIGKPIDISEALSTLTFFRTYYPAIPNIWEELTVPTGHLWSLNVEEHSYIFMSILTLIAFIRKREGIALIMIGIMAIISSIYYKTHPTSAPDLFRLRTECATSFLMISAGYSLINNKISSFITPVMPVISLTVAICCYSKWFPFHGGSTLLAPFLLSFTANHLSETSKYMIKVLCFKPLRWLGLCSYSIYLWQQPFYLLNTSSMYASIISPGVIPSFVALTLAVVVGAASFYLFENPTRQWLNERKYLLLIERYKKNCA